MEVLTQHILDGLNRNFSFALATILAHKGSTPRTSGSRMMVFKDRQLHGTIGGGLVEARVMDACIDMMSAPQNRIMEFTLDKKIKDGLDMVCGGNLTVWIETFVPPFKPSLVQVFTALADHEKNGKKTVLVSRIQGISKSTFTTDKCLILPDGTVKGSPIVPKPLFDAVCGNYFSGATPLIHNHGLEEFIVEPFTTQDTLFIFGAGHVGLQLAKMAHLTDFRTIVIDDRAEFANQERFENAHAVHVVNQFSTAMDSLCIDKNAYIVILTRGHLHDQTVLEAALKTNAAYIGMIGSRRKRDQIYANLMEKGISKKALSQVHSPIGIDIQAETPAEIAVSIIGEIIQIRAANQCTRS
ncbi:MAG: XdhC family aldehyde oxidoreductase maturation factor [Pseudomonadota bacterium]